MKHVILSIAVCAALTNAAIAAQTEFSNFFYMASYGGPATADDDYLGGGTGSNGFNHPEGIAVIGSNVYVADTGNDRIVVLGYQRTVILTPAPSNVWSMFYIGEWGTNGALTGQFSHPNDLAVGSSGEVYVVDSLNNRIQWFDGTGAWLGTFGSMGADTNQFNTPKGICIAPTNGNFMIADYGNNRVVEYTPAWEFVRAITNIVNYPPDGLAKELQLILGPYDVVVIGTNLYITEAGRDSSTQYINARRLKPANNANRFIWLNYEDGIYRDDWNIPELTTNVPVGGYTGNVFQGVRGLIDFEGVLVFAQADDSQSLYGVMDEAGYFRGRFGSSVVSGGVTPSPDEGKFAYPYNLARAGTFVFCADSGNNRVQLWKANAIPVFDYPKTNYFEVREHQVLAFTVHAKDDDGDFITYGGQLDPAGDGKNWGINSDYMKFSMIPHYGDAGQTFTLTLTASDGIASAQMLVTIKVNPVNSKHKDLVKLKPLSFEDWVYDATNDGDLVQLKLKKTAVLNHWDGSVLDVSGAAKVGVKIKRSKKLYSGANFYDKLYGEVFSTNEYALGAVAQLDVVRAASDLKSVGMRGTVGRVIFPDGLAGSVVAKAGGIGGVDGTMIKSVSATRGKIKDVVTKQSATTGGDIGGKYYPGGYGQIRAFGADRKGVSIKKVSAAGGDLSNLWMRGVGSIGGAAAKGGKDEFKMPVGGGMHSVLVRAGVNPSNDVMQAAGDVGKVQVSASIYGSSIIGAADPGTGTFEGLIIDPTEQYVGSVKKIKHGKGGGVANSLIVSKEAISGIEKVNVEPDTVVIIDGVVQ